MRLLRKKTESQTISVLASLLENLQWAMKLIGHYERHVADLEAELARQRAIREVPSLSKYVH